MDHNSRRNLVLKFIEDNQGCNAAKIVKGLDEKISRKVVFDIINNLKNEGIIIDKKTNRRDHGFYPNKNSQIFIIEKQLENLKKYLYVLFELTLPFLDNIQKSSTINDYASQKILKIIENSEEPTKNELQKILKIIENSEEPTKNELQKILKIIENVMKNELKEYDKSQVLFNKIYPLIKKNYNDFQCVYGSGLNMNKKSENKYDLTLFVEHYNKQKTAALRYKKKVSYLQPLLNEYSYLIKKSHIIHLITSPIIILHFSIYKINLDGITKWHTVIKDNEMLKRLNKRTYEYFMQINEELSKYLKESLTDPSIFSTLKKNFGLDYEKYLVSTIMAYMILGFKKEITNVCSTLREVDSEDIGRYIDYCQYSNLFFEYPQYPSFVEKTYMNIPSITDKEKK